MIRPLGFRSSRSMRRPQLMFAVDRLTCLARMQPDTLSLWGGCPHSSHWWCRRGSCEYDMGVALQLCLYHNVDWLERQFGLHNYAVVCAFECSWACHLLRATVLQVCSRQKAKPLCPRVAQFDRCPIAGWACHRREVKFSPTTGIRLAGLRVMHLAWTAWALGAWHAGLQRI